MSNERCLPQLVHDRGIINIIASQGVVTMDFSIVNQIKSNSVGSFKDLKIAIQR